MAKEENGGELVQVQTPATGLSLSDLADRINQEHAKCEAAMNTSLQHALKAGRLLLEAKRQVDHGEWGDWLHENFKGSDRTARIYMRVFRHRAELSEAEANRQTSAVLSLDGAVKLLTAPKPEPEEEPEVSEEPEDAQVEDNLEESPQAPELTDSEESAEPEEPREPDTSEKPKPKASAPQESARGKRPTPKKRKRVSCEHWQTKVENKARELQALEYEIANAVEQGEEDSKMCRLLLAVSDAADALEDAAFSVGEEYDCPNIETCLVAGSMRMYRDQRMSMLMRVKGKRAGR